MGGAEDDFDPLVRADDGPGPLQRMEQMLRQPERFNDAGIVLTGQALTIPPVVALVYS